MDNQSYTPSSLVIIFVLRVRFLLCWERAMTVPAALRVPPDLVMPLTQIHVIFHTSTLSLTWRSIERYAPTLRYEQVSIFLLHDSSVVAMQVDYYGNDFKEL